jgi:predicted MFS family arabinose efflux permease
VTALASLAVPNFRRWFVGQTLSSIGAWFHTLALALVALDLTGRGASLGIMVALQWLPLLVAGSHAGALLDRHDLRRVLLATNAVNTALATGLVVVAATGRLSTWWLGAFSLAFGIVLTIERPATVLVPVELVPPDLVSNALGLNSITLSLARLVGPALAGLSLALAGATWCFAVNAASFAVALAYVVRLDADAMFPRPRSDGGRGQVREGFAYLARRPQLRSVLVANALIGLLAVNFLVTITAVARIRFGGGALAVGLAHAANAAGAVAGGVLSGAALARMSRRLDLVCLALAGSMAAVALAPTLGLFVALGPPLGAALVAYQSAVIDACHRLAQPAMLGRMVSLVTLGAQGTTPVGSVVVGLVIDARSPQAALWVGAASCVAGAGLLAARSRAQETTVDRIGADRP